jgi:hypothetical protein
LDVRSALLVRLSDNAGAAVEYLGRRRPGKPDAATARLLAGIVTPQEDDALNVGQLREIVFGWLWESSEEVEEVASG